MEKKARILSRTASRALTSLAEGVFSHTVDIALWLAIYTAEASIPQSTSGQLWRAQVAADRFLRDVNYEVIKNALITAKRQGWIKKNRRHTMPEITQNGRKRLASMMPIYDEKRVWDGRIHLITYDIPEHRASERHLLRTYLKRIGSGRLQDSVWITPYNPIDVIRSFVEERKLVGTVIVSNLGKDGAIGEEDVHSLIVRVYSLEKLSNRYTKWLREYSSRNVDHWAVIQFLSILRDDPQLPFSLLPQWWKGREAYERVKRSLQKVII